MLTLDPSTLFYWNLSDPPPKKLKHAVESWAKSIPLNAKPPSHAPSSHVTPSLTHGSSRSTGRSVLTDAIIVTSKVARPAQIKPDPDFIDIHDGGLSDHDEIRGRERDAAVFSPPKGKVRLNSEVSILSYIDDISI